MQKKNDFLRAETSAWQHTHTSVRLKLRGVSLGGVLSSRQKKVAGRGQNRGRTAGNGVHWTRRRRRLNDVEWLQWGCVPILMHTRTHTLTHFYASTTFFFLSILLLWFAHFFCECVCGIVRARAVISSHIRYHNFPYF